MWSWIGFGLAVVGSLVAAWRGRGGALSYYEADVYHMSPQSHRRFAAASAIFAAVFLAAAAVPRLPAVPLLAVYVVFIVLYGASFVRGAAGEDE